jgi:hypothetical protein
LIANEEQKVRQANKIAKCFMKIVVISKDGNHVDYVIVAPYKFNVLEAGSATYTRIVSWRANVEDKRGLRTPSPSHNAADRALDLIDSFGS